MVNSRSKFTIKLLVTGTTHPISLCEKLTFVHSAASSTLEPIVLKNYSLIVGQAADSICVLDRGICDVGTKAGGTGSTVL